MRTRLKKIEEIVEFLYIKELVGETLYHDLHNYPDLKQQTAELFNLALEYEKLILSKQPAEHLKEPILDKVATINNIALGIEKYRQSKLFFNEHGQLIDLL